MRLHWFACWLSSILLISQQLLLQQAQLVQQLYTNSG
jgi:hypothetical protein